MYSAVHAVSPDEQVDRQGGRDRGRCRRLGDRARARPPRLGHHRRRPRTGARARVDRRLERGRAVHLRHRRRHGHGVRGCVVVGALGRPRRPARRHPAHHVRPVRHGVLRRPERPRPRLGRGARRGGGRARVVERRRAASPSAAPGDRLVVPAHPRRRSGVRRARCRGSSGERCSRRRPATCPIRSSPRRTWPMRRCVPAPPCACGPRWWRSSATTAGCAACAWPTARCSTRTWW